VHPTTRRRPSFADVTSVLALTVALSTGGAYAAGKIGAKDIQKNAVRSSHIAKNNVKTADIKGKAVTKAKLAPNARPAKVIRYTYGPHDFSVQDTLWLELPGVTKAHSSSTSGAST